MPARRDPPWRRPRPKRATGVRLTPESLAWAKARARAAGRRYPNLVDNMAAMRRQMEMDVRRTDDGRPPHLR